MTQVTFYLLAQQSDQATPEQLALACHIATTCFRNKQRCMVLCDDQASAEAFDELLWQLPADGFVPHNLSGEGPAGGAPVEICWQAPTAFNRAVLINLAQEAAPFANRYSQVYDFVPDNDSQKQHARDRFKQYRAMGCELTTLPATSINERQDG